MIIRNIGTKIVNIGTTVLMPDAETTVSNTVADAPSIQALVNMKLIAVLGEEKTLDAPVPEPRGDKENEYKNGTDAETSKKDSAEGIQKESPKGKASK